MHYSTVNILMPTPLNIMCAMSAEIIRQRVFLIILDSNIKVDLIFVLKRDVKLQLTKLTNIQLRRW